MTTNNARIYSLRPFRELRIVTVEKEEKFDANECIRVRVLPQNHLNKNEKNNCTAEIFGKELVIDKDYIFGFNEKFSIYTYTGCVVQIKGKTLQEYESKNNKMKEYLSLCYLLDAHRKLAMKKKTIGPRILITGNNNSGKSTVSLLLCNYALKSGFTPFFIEADPKCTADKTELNKGPGILSCFVYNNMNRKYSVDYFFGFLDIKEDLKLYYHLNECMSSCVHLALFNNLSQHATDFKNMNDTRDMYSAGFILSVPSEADFEIIQNLIQIYKINIVIVIDNSFLHYSLKYYYNKDGGEGMEEIEKNNFPISSKIENDETDEELMEIIGLPKFEGVIPADIGRLRYCKNLWFYNYFSKDIFIENSFFKKSHILVFKYSSTNFVKLDSTSAVPLSALPADCKTVKIENVSASYYNGDMKNLINCILGVSYSKEFSYVHIMNIAAFVHVRNVTQIDRTTEDEDEMEEEEEKEKEKEKREGEETKCKGWEEKMEKNDENEKNDGEEEEEEEEEENEKEKKKDGKEEKEEIKGVKIVKEEDEGKEYKKDKTEKEEIIGMGIGIGTGNENRKEETEKEKGNDSIQRNGISKNPVKDIETEHELSYTKGNNKYHMHEGDETNKQTDISVENNEKKNAEQQYDKDEKKKKDYLIEILCPVTITMKNIPPYFIVPGDVKQIKC